MCKRLILVVLALGFCSSAVAPAANIIFVTQDRDQDVNGTQDDVGFVDFLTELGHQVDVRRGNWTTLDAAKIAELNAADLIVVSRSTNSGDYANDATEVAGWSNLTTPVLLVASHIARQNRWLWFNSDATAALVGPRMQVVDPTHPIFKKVPLDASNQIDVVDGTTGTGQTSFIATTNVGNGKLLAQTTTGTNSWIVEWEPGLPFYAGSSQTPASRRMLFCCGTQESGPTPWGGFNLTDNGKTVFTNALNYLMGITTQVTASSPIPADGATDVPRDIVPSWTASEFAATHDIYFGANADAVSNADSTNPMDVLVSQGQSGTTYDPPGVLELGQVYYWRVDEVNGAPDFAVSKGDVWSFTVEPVSYPIQNVTATASSSNAGMGPENTVNGSGLNADDQHSTEPTLMWLSAQGGPEPTWIQYELDNVYKLDELLVWNSNQMLESLLGFGAKDVTVEYSTDGAAWTTLGDFEFPRAPGLDTYTGDAAVDFDGAVAKHVKLTINSNWGGLVAQYGLSEVRFFSIPVLPREPMPAADETGVEVDAVLSWRAGREATSHQVLFSTDEQAVIDGAATAQTVSASTFDPGPLEFGNTYYWKVIEVNEAAAPATWEGDVWSFSTREYAVVDDMESYNDTDNRIYDTWIDGLTDQAKGGSQVGYDVSPFAEKTIVHGGKQSMPFLYNNAEAPFYSEAEHEFSQIQNWTVNGADTLSLWVRGLPAAFVEEGGTIIMSAGGTDIWAAADQFRGAFKSLTNNGSIVARIESVANSDPWAKAGLMIRDSLDPGAKNAMAYVTADGRVGWQFRLLPVGTSDSTRSEPAAIALPHWLRLTRTGSTIKAEHSSNGTTWEPMIEAANPTEPTARDIAMNSTVYIGLAVTSHNATVMTTAEFSNISTAGAVTGAWQVEAIGVAQPANDPAPLYVAVEDSAGKKATATNPEAVTSADWTQWQIPLSDLAGVNLARVEKMTIGVGNRTSPVQGGSGIVYIDDIGYGHPAAQ